MADPQKSFQPPFQHPRGWIAKFALAFRGIVVGVRQQNSFLVDIPVAMTVVALAWFLGADRVEWCLLLLCIAMVISAELFNSAIEKLARAVTREENPHIRDALDIASGAVLVVAISAAAVGVVVLGALFFG